MRKRIKSKLAFMKEWIKSRLVLIVSGLLICGTGAAFLLVSILPIWAELKSTHEPS